jgi:hypothetical protein
MPLPKGFPLERLEINGKLIETPSFQEEAVFLGDLRPGIIEKSYNQLVFVIGIYGGQEKWAALMEHLMPLSPPSKRNFRRPFRDLV